MKLLMSFLLGFTGLALPPLQPAQKPVPLFDGRTFTGWEGDTKTTWRIQDGAIVGGSLSTQVPRNEFLTTTRSFGDFVLRVKFKLAGSEGFINGGVQIRSQRVKEPPNELSGYQADLGDKYWGSLYDESRRSDHGESQAWRLERLRNPGRGSADPSLDQRPSDGRLHRDRSEDSARRPHRVADPRRGQG